MSTKAASSSSEVAPLGAGARILLIEDEPQLRKLSRIALSSRGYHVIETGTAQEGIDQARKSTPDVVLLDLGLPDRDGREVVTCLRTWSHVPIVIISARDHQKDKIEALSAGADDYLAKPFGSPELFARGAAALRHAALIRGPAPSILNIGTEITIDLMARVVVCQGEEVRLTPTEYKVLVVLVTRAGLLVTHRQLVEHGSAPGHEQRVESLCAAATQLRRKLGEQPARPKYIATELGVGYRLKIDR